MDTGQTPVRHGGWLDLSAIALQQVSRTDNRGRVSFVVDLGVNSFWA